MKRAIKITNKETRRINLLSADSIILINKDTESEMFGKTLIQIYLVNGSHDVLVDSDKVDAIYDMIENFLLYPLEGGDILEITI